MMRHPVVAIHQPNFLPWPGFFQKMMLADVFIWLNSAPFTKNSFQNRNRILTRHGIQWLTVPVLTGGRHGHATDEIIINNSVNWKRKHLKTLMYTYGKSPGFKWVWPGLEQGYEPNADTLSRFNQYFLEWICSLLEIAPEIHNSRDLNEAGVRTDRLISLIQSVGGKTYISGAGGRGYLDREKMEDAGIELVFLESRFEPYDQGVDEFVPGLSIIDSMFRLGRQVCAWIRSDHSAVLCQDNLR